MFFDDMSNIKHFDSNKIKDRKKFVQKYPYLAH